MNRVFKSILLRLALFQVGFVVATLAIAAAYARGTFSPRTLGILLVCLIATAFFVLIRFVFRRTTQPEAVTETLSVQDKASRVRFLKVVIVFLFLALAAGLLNFPRNGPALPLFVGIGVNVSFIIVTYRLLRRIQQQ